MSSRRILKTTGFVLLSLGAFAALGALVVRDQISRHRRDLFSSHPLRRLAALGYLSGRVASVELVQLLRDFVAWERSPMLRKRGLVLLGRMEAQLRSRPVAGEAAG